MSSCKTLKGSSLSATASIWFSLETFRFWKQLETVALLTSCKKLQVTSGWGTEIFGKYWLKCLWYWAFKHFMTSSSIDWVADMVFGGKNIKRTLKRWPILGCAGQLLIINATFQFSLRYLLFYARTHSPKKMFSIQLFLLRLASTWKS